MKIFALIVSVAIVSCANAADSTDYIVAVEKYLNEITTFESDFVQLDGRGRYSYGHFLLKRPYLMKMDYKNPSTHVIIAKDNQITHYNRELKEKTVTLVYSSPLSFFLDKKIDLQNNLEVLSFHDDNDVLSIEFCKKNQDSDGTVTLIFSKNPLILRKWIISSNKGGESMEISLINWKYKHPISDKEFKKFN